MSGQVISKTQKGRAFPHHTAGDSLNQSLNISGWSDKPEFYARNILHMHSSKVSARMILIIR